LTVAGTGMVPYKRAREAKWRVLDLMFPLGAAMLASVSQNIRKLGLNNTNEPIIAATISTATSRVCLFGPLVFSGKKSSIQLNRPCLPCYGGAALFVIGLTTLFLRGEENVQQKCRDRRDPARLRHRRDHRAAEVRGRLTRLSRSIAGFRSTDRFAISARTI
jgi:hypothetical protein